MINLIVVKHNQTTRITLGCRDRVEALRKALIERGYAVTQEEGEPPKRDADEVNRAQRILAEVYDAE